MYVPDPNAPISLPEDDLPRMTIEEYLSFEERSEQRHEFVDGYLFVLAGPSIRHELIVNALRNILVNHLKGSQCKTFGSSLLVRIDAANSMYYPDLFVTCSAPLDQTKNYLKTPILVVEVLSPSTGAIDRREKLLGYEKIDSLREYLIVYQSVQRVDLYRKDGCRFSEREIITSGNLELQSLPVGPLTIPIESVYEELDWGGPPEPVVREQAVSYTW